MSPYEWTLALQAALERLPVRRRPEVRAARVTPGGYRIFLQHHELTHRRLLQALLARAEVSRVLDTWDTSHGPLEICFTLGGDEIYQAEEMITVDARGVHTQDPLSSRRAADALTDEGAEAWFRRATGAVLPFSLPSGMARCGATAWETPGASDAFGGLPTNIVILENPIDLAIIGHYGAAPGSASLYYISAEGPHYAFLRLHFGGAVGSISQDRRYVTAFLRGYARFRDGARDKLRRSILIHNEGKTTLRVDPEGAEHVASDLIDIPCSSWREAEESFDALFEEGRSGA